MKDAILEQMMGIGQRYFFGGHFASSEFWFFVYMKGNIISILLQFIEYFFGLMD